MSRKGTFLGLQSCCLRLTKPEIRKKSQGLFIDNYSYEIMCLPNAS